MYLAGYPFEEFLQYAKKSLLLSCLELGDVKSISIEFSTSKLPNCELVLEGFKYQHSNGQYFLQGKEIAPIILRDKILTHSRVIDLVGKITLEEG